METGGRNCVSCHDLPGQQQNSGALGGFNLANFEAQNMLCLDCHFEQPDAMRAQRPHSADEATLQLAIEKAAQQQRLEMNPSRMPAMQQLASVAPPANRRGGELACATCHNEHEGRGHDLTAMSSTQCQACHQNQFKGFPEGHPPFTGAAGKTRPPGEANDRGISFDHQAHRERYFGGESFDCNRCHSSDQAGRFMELNSFARSCADCHTQSETGDHHGEQIRDVQQVLLRIPPGLEGPWSRDAQSGPPELPATMLLLLAGAQREQTVRALDHLYSKADGDLFSWEPSQESGEDENSGDLRQRLTRGVMQLVDDLTAPDATYWLRHRLARALDANPDAEPIAELARSLSEGRVAVKAYASRWLTRNGNDSIGQRSGGAAWYFADNGRVVGYRPAEHVAPLLKSTLDSLTRYLNKKKGKDTPGKARERGETAKANVVEMRLRLARRAGSSLTSLKAPAGPLNACTKCHQQGGGQNSRSIAWQQPNREPGETGFGKFRHAPHFALLGQSESCQQCHVFVADSDAPSAEMFHQRDFMPYEKDMCSRCHKQGQASTDCLTCHQYHWTEP